MCDYKEVDCDEYHTVVYSLSQACKKKKRKKKKKEAQRRNNLHPLQANEQPFILDQRSAVPFTQLIDPIDTPDEYQRCGGAQEHHEDLESPA